MNVKHSLYISHRTTKKHHYQHVKDPTDSSQNERTRVTVKWKDSQCEEVYEDAGFTTKKRRIRGRIDAAREIYLREKNWILHRAHASRVLLKRATERRTLRFSRERVFNRKWH